MAKKYPLSKRNPSLPDDALSLFDRENLEALDALRYADPLDTPPASTAGGTDAVKPPGDADVVYTECRIDDGDETWGMGELNIKVVHRGRIRIRREQWRQVIGTCSAGFSEEGIRKDFHLNILQHPSCVRLIYISYRYKQAGDKQRECRRGILVDDKTDMQNMMTNLAYWFTAQPHAERNFNVFKTLVDEAMSKSRPTPPPA